VVEPGQRRPGMDRVIEREISCPALHTLGIYKYTPATISRSIPSRQALVSPYLGSAHRLPQQQSRERSSAEPSCRPLRLQLACSNPSPPYLTREVPCGAACKNRLNRIYVRKIHLAPIRLCRSHWIRAAVRIRHDELAYLFFQWTGIAFDPSQCRASATWLTGKHWAAPYASSLLTGLGHRPGAGSGLLPRLRPPACPRHVIGAGLLGIIPYAASSSVARSPGPRYTGLLRFEVCDCCQ